MCPLCSISSFSFPVSPLHLIFCFEPLNLFIFLSPFPLSIYVSHVVSFHYSSALGISHICLFLFHAEFYLPHLNMWSRQMKENCRLWSIQMWMSEAAELLCLYRCVWLYQWTANMQIVTRLTAKLWLSHIPHWLSIRFLQRAQTLLLSNLSLHISLSLSATFHLEWCGPFVESSQFLEVIYLISTCGNTCFKSYEESVKPNNAKKCSLEHLRLFAEQV